MDRNATCMWETITNFCWPARCSLSRCSARECTPNRWKRSTGRRVEAAEVDTTWRSCPTPACERAPTTRSPAASTGTAYDRRFEALMDGIDGPTSRFEVQLLFQRFEDYVLLRAFMTRVEAFEDRRRLRSVPGGRRAHLPDLSAHRRRRRLRR